MASTNLYLDLRGKAKDGRGSVLIVLSHNRTTTTFSTGIRLLPSEWKNGKVVGRQDAKVLNAGLLQLRGGIDSKVAVLSLEPEFQTMSAPDIKNRISGKKVFVKDSKRLVTDMFEEYMSREMRDNTRSLYDLTLKKIIAFSGKNLTMDQLDYKWLVDFEKFLASTQRVNGRAIYLRNLRAVCNYAVKTGAVHDYAFKNFSVKQEPTQKRNITVDKLREFYKYPCKGSDVLYRDYFFLMFYLIGINAKDLFLARPEAIVKGRLEYIRQKTNKRYSIKIEPEAQALLNRYKGKNYLVEVMDRCKVYSNFLHEMNDALGMIGPTKEEEFLETDDLFSQPIVKKVPQPIIPDITSYYARHTWATFAYDLEIPVDIIAQALGHSFGNRTTMIYINRDASKVDAANRRVIDFFLEGL